MIILREEFAKFTELTDQANAQKGSSESILSYFSASKEEVDAVMKTALLAGGTRAAEPKEQPWGYAGYLKDPNGHVWEIMWNPALSHVD